MPWLRSTVALIVLAVVAAPPARVSADPLPTGWITSDIGSVGVAGTASGLADSFTVEGSGADIWGTADAFRFVYQRVTGDTTVIARVATIEFTHRWAKAGVMLRETLAAGSRHATVFVSAGQGLAFQRRSSTNGSSAHTAGSGAAAPHWVKLVRSGTTFTAYTSADGAAWTRVGSQTISMADTIYAGLAVTSHDNSTLATATFDRVSVTAASGGPALAREPFLQQVSANGALIVWGTFDPAAGEIRYRKVGGSLQTASSTRTLFRAADTGLGYDFYQHEAELFSLASDASYDYDVFVNGEDATAGTDRFSTAPSTGSGTARFIAFGDSGTGSLQQRQLAQLMAADTFDLALHTGDLAYGNSGGTGDGTFTTIRDWFFEIYRDRLRRAPMFPSMGNHDSRAGTQHGAHYRASFVLPENGASASYPDHAERFYSFDYGPVHFVALDTELAFQDSGRRSAQLAWLDADLAATSQPWKVVYFHRSPYSAGGEHGSDLAVRSAFAPLFEKHGVQLVLSAHEHVYERTVPLRESGNAGYGRVTYIVTGGGGGPLYPSGTAAWTAYSASRHHYVRATATSCELAVEAVGLSGSVFDRVTLGRCSASDTTPPAVTLLEPAAGATVSGTTPVRANASDNVGVTRVDLWVDGALAASDGSAPYEFAWNTSAETDGAHTLQVRAHDASGNTGSSATHTVTVSNGNTSLPGGWSSSDVGAVGRAGSAAENGGTFTVRGSGADIWGTNDAFHFAYRALSGDGSIVARVASISGTDAWTKMGVMVRGSTAPDSAYAFMLVSVGKGVAFQRRTSNGAQAVHSSGGSGTAPRWVRLTRTGSRLTASVSTNGANWTAVGSDTLTLPSSVLVGLAATSHDNSALATGTFDNVAITTGPAALPAGWSSRDIGSVGRTGSATATGGTFTVRGAGDDVWGTSDAFHYAWRTLDGDGSIVARVASLNGTQAWTKVGVMIRGSTDPGASYAFMLVSLSKGFAFQRRPAAGASALHTSGGAGTAPRWVKLDRRGTVITASLSANGTDWTVVGSDTFAMPTTALIGLAASSHDTSVLATGTFDGVTVTP